ncbi:MAG: DUF4838 domain-containing protein [Firmicutes bacterium]|nr:DUF4838 domain-containing protein [Bacillota bacterium]
MNANKYILAENGLTSWHIVVSWDASETEKYAADELHHFIYKVTRSVVPVITDKVVKRGPEILVGPSNRYKELGININLSKLGSEGFIIKTIGDNLVITGAKPRGTIYGVYTFLEDYLGCRWFSSKVSRIPQRSKVALPEIDDMQVPAFDYREAYWRDAFDGNFAVRNKLNSNKADITERQGGKFKFFNFHHSFNDLVPVEKYFSSHPEYFSEINGKRISERTQLCLTNPDVLKLCIERVKEWIKQDPSCNVYSVAQNDWYNFCTCEKCRAVDEREESHAGTMITFVNKIAEAIEEEYPDKFIHTFAYQYTRKTPKFVRPAKNVIVRLCTIECCFSHPLETCDVEAIRRDKQERTTFLSDLKAWSQICENLYIWDYVTNFANYMMPFPNLHVLQPNLQLFHKYGVKGVLEQGNFSHGGGGTMAELEAYVQAKLLWNPYIDVKAIINEFLVGYFGQASIPISQYLDMMENAVKPYHMSIYDMPDAPYFTDELLNKAEALFDQAEYMADDDAVLERVRSLRLQVTYTILSRMPLDSPFRSKMVDRFAQELKRHGITEIFERKNLQMSIDKMKASRYSHDREGLYRVDYRM